MKRVAACSGIRAAASRQPPWSGPMMGNTGRLWPPSALHWLVPAPTDATGIRAFGIGLVAIPIQATRTRRRHVRGVSPAAAPGTGQATPADQPHRWSPDVQVQRVCPAYAELEPAAP